MGKGTSYTAPDLDVVNVQIVRDELLKCFESANSEFARILNQPSNDEQLRQHTKQFITSVFNTCGASFENPSKEGIVSALELCRKNAENMMGSDAKEIIDHHYSEMIKLVNKL